MSRRLIAALALFHCLWIGVPFARAGDPMIHEQLDKLLDESSFVAFDDEAFEQSRDGLLSALRTAPADIEEDEWSYLRTESVARALKDNSTDLQARLTNLVDKLNQDFTPYEKPQLLKVRSLVRRHLLLIKNRDRREQLRLSFQSEKRALAEALTKFAESGNPVQHRRLAAGIRWMQDHEMASDFVAAAKQLLSFPNLQVQMPASLLQSASMTELPTQNEPIDRTSDGIRTRGNIEGRSRAYLQPVSTSNHGDFRLQFSGEFQLTARNTRQRVQFHTRATTRVSALAAIAVDENSIFSSGDLRVCATSDLRNGRACVNRRVGGRVIGRIVDCVVKKKTPELERALSQELRDRVQSELGEQLAEFIGKVNTTMEDQFWSPARRLDLVPRLFSVTTTDQHAQLTVLEDNQCGLAASRPFDSPLDGLGYAAFHDSLLTDVMNSFYVRRMNPASLNADLVQRLNSSLPVQVFREVALPDEIRLTFELDFPRPLRVKFVDGMVHLTLKAKRVVLDEKTFSDRDLTLSYRVSAGPDNTLRFDLQGAPRLSLPHDADANDPPELIKAIHEEFLAGLRSEFDLDLNDLLGSDKPLPLQIARVASEHQWLVLSLDKKAESGLRIVSTQ